MKRLAILLLLVMGFNLLRLLLLLVLAGFRWDAVAPILTGEMSAQAMVDPVPQAMVLTAIVIGVGVQALALSLVVRIHQRYATLDMREARRWFDQGLGLGFGDVEVRNDRPIREVAAEILTWLGWA